MVRGRHGVGLRGSLCFLFLLCLISATSAGPMEAALQAVVDNLWEGSLEVELADIG
jgi:hypothetical protein